MLNSPPKSLSLFYKILVYLEDRTTGSLSDFLSLGNTRQAIGAVGRLESLGYIKRHHTTPNSSYELTDRGDALLASILDFLPQTTPWDKTWHGVVFTIPESARAYRQFARLKLMDLGIRLYKASVWLSPYEHALEKFKLVISDSPAAKFMAYFTASMNDTTQPAEAWNWKKLETDYRNLFSELTKATQKPLSPFEAKCCLVAMALITRHDPSLALKHLPKSWIGYDVSTWYKKIRPQCQ